MAISDGVVTTVRVPDLVRGTDLRELPRCMPVVDLRPATRFNGEPVTRRGVYVGNNTVKADEGLVVWTHYARVRDEWPTYIGHLAIDWSDRAAIYLSLAWLADRGHACLWMLPTAYGGRVEAWDGLTAWEVSAILVARSVGRVARGLGPILRIYIPSNPVPQPNGSVTLNGFWFPDMARALAEIAENSAKAVADGCAIRVPGGLIPPDLGGEHV